MEQKVRKRVVIVQPLSRNTYEIPAGNRWEDGGIDFNGKGQEFLVLVQVL
jgi:hypothetical protein